MSLPVEVRPGAVRFCVRVQARARQEGIAGMDAGGVRVRVAAAPVAGTANGALVALLASRLQVPRGSIKILAGQHSRIKMVEVVGLDPATVVM